MSDIKNFLLRNATPSYINMREKRWKEQDMHFNGKDITFSLYKQLLEYQGYRCALCGIRLDFTTPQLDHDHETGEIRGVLCYDCNRKRVGLYERTGKFKSKHFEKIIMDYLTNPPASHLQKKRKAE